MNNNISPIWHPFTQHALLSQSICIEKAQGTYLFSSENRVIIDAISSWWVVTHGHCHPRIVDAVQKQGAKLDQIIFAGFSHEPAEILAMRLLKHVREPLEYVFYSDSGSTSIEVALKMAIGFWEHKGSPRKKIVALEGGYHGDTFGAMSAGGRGIYNRLYEPFLFDVLHLPFPEEGNEEFTFSVLDNVLSQYSNDIAAFIFEPLIQGAAGMRFYSPQVLKTLTDKCRKHGILLIADEVMTGFGRTGTMFACDQAGFTPDLLCLSKGLTAGFLPMGATIASREIYSAFYHKDRGKMFFHSTSFTGNPLACAAAAESLRIWEEEPVKERISSINRAYEVAFARFSKRDDVLNLRAMGCIFAFEVQDNHVGYLSSLQPKLYDLMLSCNVLLRPIGNTVYILPPYCVSKDDLEKIYDCIDFALDCLRNEGK